MVINNLFFLSLKFIFSMEWCDHVIVNPDEIKIIVFISGMSNGLKGLIPKGGHNCPISIDGDKEE
jgi:hypothetical protein